MKNQGNRAGGILLLAMAGVFAVFIAAVTIIVTNVTSKAQGPIFPFYIAPIVVGGIMLPVFVALGLSMLIKGNKSRAIMKTGRRSECKVYNILHMRNGFQLIVSFRGDSGNEFKHALYINYKDAALLRPDMTIECYIQGDDCYVDPSHIVIRESDDE